MSYSIAPIALATFLKRESAHRREREMNILTDGYESSIPPLARSPLYGKLLGAHFANAQNGLGLRDSIRNRSKKISSLIRTNCGIISITARKDGTNLIRCTNFSDHLYRADLTRWLVKQSLKRSGRKTERTKHRFAQRRTYGILERASGAVAGRELKDVLAVDRRAPIASGVPSNDPYSLHDTYPVSIPPLIPQKRVIWKKTHRNQDHPSPGR